MMIIIMIVVLVMIVIVVGWGIKCQVTNQLVRFGTLMCYTCKWSPQYNDNDNDYGCGDGVESC